MIRRVCLILTVLLPLLIAVEIHSADAASTRQVQSGAIHSSGQLRIPLSAGYPPAGFKTNANTAMTPADADSATLQALFLHGGYLRSNQSYHDIGALGLWYQEFVATLPSGHNMWLTYLGSYYTSPDTAAGAFNDVVGSGIFSRVQTCQVPGAEQCLDVTLGFVGPGIDPTYFPVLYADDWRIMLKSNALLESGYLIPQSDLAANQAQGQSALQMMTSAFLELFNGSLAGTPTPGKPSPTPATPKRTPTGPRATPKATIAPATPVEFQLHNIRVEKVGAPFNADKPGKGILKAGRRVVLSVYVVLSGPSGTPVQAAIEVLQRKKALFQKSGSLNLPRDESNTTLRFTFPYRVKGSGAQTVRAGVQMGNQPAQYGTIKILVKK
ncbi:MAG TPA: hypothetical protein VF898_11595 [Chloroflexota bacterium]